VARFHIFPEMENLQLGGPQFNGSGLAALVASPKLHRLSLKESRNISDAGSAVGLSGLSGLEFVSLDHNPVETLPFVRKMTKLQTLDLAHTKIRNLSGIENCTALADFRASNTPLSDSDVAPLAGLTQMKSMTLYGTNLSDASLVNFEAMAGLTSLNLTNTYVTAAGAAKLRAKLPACDIQIQTKAGSPPVLPPVPIVAVPPAVVAPPGTTAPTGRSLPGPSVELLPLVQLPRDKVQGNWSWKGSTLSLKIGGGPGSRVQIPYTPAGDEYDLTLTARHAWEPRKVSVIVGLVAGGRQIYCRVGRQSAGISDGDAGRAPNLAEYAELPMEQPFTIVCSVRKDSVRVRFNDRQVYEFQGDFGQLVGPEIKVPRLDQFFLSSDIDAAFDFNSLRITPYGWTAAGQTAATTPSMPTVPMGTAPFGTLPLGSPTSAAAVLGERRPVPEAQAKQAALATIKDVFKEGYAAAKTPPKKEELAVKLYEQSKSAADDTERYVLLEEALKIGTEGDVLNGARGALYDLVSDFKVPKAETYVDGWKAMLAGARSPETVRALLGDMSKLFDGAVKLAAFDDAKAIGDYAATAAQRLRDVAEIKSVRDRNAELAARQKEYAAAKVAAEKLTTSPDDPAANFSVGRYRALVERDWGTALPLLAKGSDSVWKDLAAKTLAAGGNPAALSAVADAWWDAAQSKPAQKAELAAGARQWYQTAFGSLAGLQKTRVEKRIAEAGLLVVESKLPATLLPVAGGEAVASAATADDKPFMPVPAFGDPKPAIASPGAPSVGPSIRPLAGAPNFAIERRAAEWVLSVGGRVNVKFESGRQETLTALPLPNEPFAIVTVLVRNCQGVTDESMSNLAGISRLEFADLAATPVTGVGLAHLTGSVATVTKFNCDSAAITDDGMAQFSRFTNLQNLSLGRAKITDRGLAAVAPLKNLRSIGLSGALITDEGAPHLAGLTQLTSLGIRETAFGDAGLMQLGNLTELVALDLASTRVTDASMSTVVRYGKLQNLNLGATSVTDASVVHFERLNNLKSLPINSTNITAEGAARLRAKLPGCHVGQ
jgi:hypothetical protein